MMITHYLKVAFRNLWALFESSLPQFVEIQDTAPDCVGWSGSGLAVFQHLFVFSPLCFQYESLFCKL